MKPWIPLLAGLSVSGAVLFALWLEDPPPPLEWELAAPLPLPPPPPPAPLVRAAVAPSVPPPPQASQVQAPAPEEEVPPQIDDPGDSPRPGSDAVAVSPNPVLRAKRAARIAQAMAGRNLKLRDELTSAIASGDREAEARIRALMERAEERMERARLQVETLRRQSDAERQ
ncbi:MAG: hypothetical protein M3Y59_10325 [Myxococcota bacterium]|nr:hypothetical protein [Myxococcota bacterium]